MEAVTVDNKNRKKKNFCVKSGKCEEDVLVSTVSIKTKHFIQQTVDCYLPILLCDIFVINVAGVVSVGWADAFAANIIKALEIKGAKRMVLVFARQRQHTKKLTHHPLETGAVKPKYSTTVSS